jgi:hypothetical protein
MFSPTSYFFVKKVEREDFSEKKAEKRNFKRKEEKEAEWNARSFMLLFKWGIVVALCH